MRKLFLSIVFLSICTMSMFAQKSAFSKSISSENDVSGWIVGQHWRFSHEGALFYARFAGGTDTLITPFISISGLDNGPSIKLVYKNILNVRWTNTIRVLCRAREVDEFEEVKVITDATETEDVQTEKFMLPEKFFPTPRQEMIQVAIVVSYEGGASTAISQLSIENLTAKSPTQVAIYPHYNGAKIDFSEYANTNYSFVNIKVASTVLTDPDNEQTNVVINATGIKSTNFETTTSAALEPNTTYYLYIQGDFSDGGLSPWYDTVFTTEGVISFPYVVDFEENEDLASKIQIVRSSTSTTNGYDEVTSAVAKSGSRSFHFQATAGNRGYILLPAINGDIKNYELQFFVYKDVPNVERMSILSIGIVTGALETGDFYEIRRLELSTEEKWEKCVVQFNDYNGSGRRIMIRAGSSQAANSLNIDSIVVCEKSDCPTPSLLNVYGISNIGAKFSWLDGTANSEWDLYVSSTDIDPRTISGARTINENPYTYSFTSSVPFTPTSTYYAYLRTHCNSGESEWVKTTFTTKSVLPCNYTDSFSTYSNMHKYGYELPDGWVSGARSTGSDKENTNTSWVLVKSFLDSTVNHATSSGVAGCLKIGVGNGDYISYIMLPALDCEDITSKAIDFMVTAMYDDKPSASEVEVYLGYARQQTNEIGEGFQFKSDDPNIHITDTLNLKTEAGNWHKVLLPFKNYKPEYGSYVVLAFKRISKTTIYLYVDEFRVFDAPSCYPVLDLKAVPHTTNSVKLTWKEKLQATQWVVKASRNENFDPVADNGDLFEQTVNTTECIVSNEALQAGDTLYVSVRPVCQGDAQEWSSVKEVTTNHTLSLPYYTNFESETTGQSVYSPQKWITGNALDPAKNGNTPYVAASGSWTANNNVLPKLENKHLLINHTKATYKPYVILPAIPQDVDMKDIRMSFYMLPKTTKLKGYLKIGVVDNVSSGIENVTMVKEFIGTPDKEIEFVNVSFENYTGTGKNIVLYNDVYIDTLNDNATVNTIMIDNLTIVRKTSLLKVSEVTASDKTDTSMKLTWKENGMATNWRVRLFTEKRTTESAINQTEVKSFYRDFEVSGTSSTILSDLQTGMRCFIFVQPVTKSGSEITEAGPWSTVLVDYVTTCNTVTLPYVDSFDLADYNSAIGLMGPCYGVYNSSTGSHPYLALYNNASIYNVAPYNTGNLIYLRALKEAGTVGQLEFPAFVEDVNTVQLTIDACARQSNIGEKSKTEFGVLTQDNEFHLVETRQLDKVKVWEQWVINFSQYTGEQGRIAIRMVSTGEEKAIVLDNARIEPIPAVPLVQHLKVKRIDSTTATVKWENGSSWEVVISDKITTMPDTLTIYQTTSPEYTFTNLQPKTTYYVYVRSKNGSEVGVWSKYVSFKTHYPAFTLPFYTDFHGYKNNAVVDSFLFVGDADKSAGAAILDNGSSIVTMPVLRISQVNKDYKNCYCVLPVVKCESLNDVQLQMTVYPGTSSQGIAFFEIGVFVDPYDLTTYQALYTDSVEYVSGYDAREVLYDFRDYRGSGKYIAIRPLNRVGCSTCPTYGQVCIDNVLIDEYDPCPTPLDLKSKEIGKDFVELTWNGKATDNYEVRLYKYNTVSTPDPDTDTPDKEVSVTANNSTRVTGLEANTPYVAVVRKKCEENTFSSWSSQHVFSTGCAEVQSLPYFENFNSLSLDLSHPKCWTDYKNLPGTNSSQNNVGISKKDDNAYLYMKTTSTTPQYNSRIYSPKLDIDKLENLIIYFDVRSYNDNSITTVGVEIGATEELDIDAPSIFITSVQHVGKEFTRYCVKLRDFGPYTAQYKYIYFAVNSVYNNAFYLDNIEFVRVEADDDDLPLLPIHNLLVTDIAPSYLSISFDDANSSVEGWEVAWVNAGESEPIDGDTMISTKEFTIDHLLADHAYDIYVRGVQQKGTSEEKTSEWVKMEGISTIATSYATVPYSTSFEDDNENGKWTMQWASAYNSTVTTAYRYFYLGEQYKLPAISTSSASQFVIADASQCGGEGTKALYVSTGRDGLGQYPYAYDKSGRTGYYAYRNFYLQRGKYNIRLKVKCEGARTESVALDYQDQLHVRLLPAGSIIVQVPQGKMNKRYIVIPNGKVLEFGTKSNATDGIYAVLTQYKNHTNWDDTTLVINVEKDGYYQLNMLWENNDTVLSGVAYGNPAAIDSISIMRKDEETCTNTMAEGDVQLCQIDTTSATYFINRQTGTRQYVLATVGGLQNPLGNASIIIAQDLNASDTIELVNLRPCTDYYLYTRIKCTELDNDAVWLQTLVHTPCYKKSLPYYQHFADNFTPDKNAKYYECMTFHPKCTTEAICKYILDNGTRDTVKSITLAKGSYLVLPEFDADIKDLYIEVGLRGNMATKAILELGVMDDPEQTSTFKTLKLMHIQDMVSSSNDPLKLEKFGYILNDYKGTGRYLAIRNNMAPSMSAYVRYVRVANIQCASVLDLVASEITQVSAKLSWKQVYDNENGWNIKVSDGNENKVIFVSATDANVTYSADRQIVSYQLTNLTPGNLNIVSVQSKCGSGAGDTSFYSVPTVFTSGCPFMPLPYIETFDNVSATANGHLKISCWNNLVCASSIENVWSGDATLQVPMKTQISSYFWYQNTHTALGDGSMIVSNNSIADNADYLRYKWLTSPTIVLTNTNDDIYMTFTAKYCTNEGGPTTTYNDRFFIAISTDGGATWTRENSVQISLDNMTNDMTIYSVNLSQYKGQNIKFALYHESTKKGLFKSASYLVIDDIKINETRVESKSDNVCDGSGYFKDGIEIPVTKIPSLGRSLTYPIVNRTDSIDYIINLTLTTYAETDKTITKSQCGDTCFVGSVMFEYALRDTTTPYLAYLPNKAGCDSLVYVYFYPGINDTITQNVTLNNNQLPRVVDKYLTIETPINSDTTIIRTTDSLDNCKLNYIKKYIVHVDGGGSGLNTPFGDIVKVQVFDCLGRLMYVQDNPQLPIRYNLPIGVYTIRYYYANGATKISRQIVK